MADDLKVAIRLSVDGKQAVGELKVARAEMVGLSAEAKRSGLSQGLKESAGHARNLAGQMGSLGQGLRGSAFHAKFLAEGMSAVSRETVKAKSAVSELLAGLRSGVAQGIAGAFAAGAIIKFTREVGQAAIQLQKTQATLQFATGSAVEAANGYQFARQEAQRLGLEVAATAQSYAKFSAAARGTSLSADDVKVVFTGLAEASRALGLSTGETENATRALVQMLSKGKITAEEFRTQLSDALPGATRIAAQALGVTTEEFSRMLDAGELTLDLIPKLGRAFHEEFGVTATQAAKGLAAETNRLSNAWTEFLEIAGDTGAISVAIKAMEGLGGALQAVNALLKTYNDLFPTDLAPEELLGGRRGYLLRGATREQLDSQRGRSTVANLVPGGASAVPRQGGEKPAVLRETELNFEKKGLEQVQARQKAEAEAHKASLKQVRELAAEHKKSLKEREDREKAIRSLQQEAFDDNLDSIAEEQKAWKDSLDAISDGIKERQKLEKDAAEERTLFLKQQAEQQSRIMLAPFENALQGIQSSFTDAFASIFSGGVDTFSDLARTIKSVFVRLAAEIAALLVFRPIVSGILGAVGLSGVAGALGLGGGAAGGANILGSGLDLLSGASSLSSLFGGPSLTGALTGGINSLGAASGLFGGAIPGATNIIGGSSLISGPTSTIGTFGGASLGSILGSAGAGAGIGGLISGLLGGNTTVGTIAGGVGGVAGSVAGSALSGAAAGSVVPVIGTIIGAILGGILGGLIKPSVPRGHTVHEVGAGTIREAGKGGFNPNSFAPLTKSIDKALIGAGKLLDISVKGARYFIGFSADKGFSAHPDVYSKDQKDLTRTILLEELNALAKTPFQKAALERAGEKTKLEDVLGSIVVDVQFKKDWEKLPGDLRKALAPSQARDRREQLHEQLKGIDKEFAKKEKLARELDLPVSEQRQAQRVFRREFAASQVPEDIRTLFAPKSPARELREQLKEMNKEFKEMVKLMEEAGLSTKRANKVQKELKRDFLAGRAGGAVGQIRQNLDALGVTGLRAFRDELNISPDIAPLERAAEAMRRFDELKKQALGGDLTAVRDLPEAAQRALAIQQEVFANGPQTARFRDEIRELLDGLIIKLTPSKFNLEDLNSTMRELGTIQIAQLQKQTNRQIDALEAILRQLRKAA